MDNTFLTLGASNHTKKERQKEDYYATEPKALELLLELEKFNNNVWECACGEGYLSRVLKKAGYNGRNSDIVDRGYGEVYNFLDITNQAWNGDIITNPPYKYAQEFIEKALFIIPTGNKVAMFLKIQFLESKRRKELFRADPPKIIYVASSRLNCAMNGDFIKYSHNSAVAYAWFIWEKGFKGDPIIKWFN